MTASTSHPLHLASPMASGAGYTAGRGTGDEGGAKKRRAMRKQEQRMKEGSAKEKSRTKGRDVRKQEKTSGMEVRRQERKEKERG